MSLLDQFSQALDDLNAQQRLRVRRVVSPVHAQASQGSVYSIDGQTMLSFGGNDYLGLSQHPAMIEAAQQGAARYGVGATASPLVCGHSPAHEALETELASFVGLPKALYFCAGYAANVGIVPALVGAGDAIFSDALNHACLIDGARLSKAAVHVYPHQDLVSLDAALSKSDACRKLVISDAVFSMDGSVVDVRALLALCEKHDALLLLDDAHGFGVLGENGEGVLSYAGIVGQGGVTPDWQGGRLDRLIYMATLGKAAGVSGAFVAAHPVLIEWLMQAARTYMFATATPAMLIEAVRAALPLIAKGHERRERLQTLQSLLRAGLPSILHQSAGNWRLLPSMTAIQPLVIGANDAALALMAALGQQGIWLPAIRPPTVPAGTARLRISLSAAHTTDHMEQLLAALRKAASDAAS